MSNTTPESLIKHIFSSPQKYRILRGIAAFCLTLPLLGNMTACGNIPEDDVAAAKFMDDFSDKFVRSDGNPSSLDVPDAVSPEFAPKSNSSVLRVATFNVLGDGHTDSNGNLHAFQSGADRMIGTIALLNSYDIDIAGLQGFQPSQWSTFDEKASDKYGIYPNPKKYPISVNSFVYKKDRIRILPSSDTISGFKYFNGKPLTLPLINFVDLETGLEYTSWNTHDPANVDENTVNSQMYRLHNVKKHRDLAQKLSKLGKKILLVGDFNSSGDVRPSKDVGQTRKDLAYCKITENGDMKLAYDTFHNKTGHCPSVEMPLIDHIYVSNGTNIDRFGVDTVSRRDGVSDHPLVFADIAPDSKKQ